METSLFLMLGHHGIVIGATLLLQRNLALVALGTDTVGRSADRDVDE